MGEDPSLLAGEDSEKVARANRARSTAYKPALELITTFTINWTLVASATPAWARAMFPDEPEEAALARLWDAIFAASRVDVPDPVAAWKAHNAALAARAKYLNDRRYSALRFRGPGTDLTVGLADEHSWDGGADTAKNGIACSPNIPTEEVFTTPHKDRVDGHVTSTKPLSYQGTLIEKIAVRFEGGRIVEAHAKTGENVLRKVLDTDEGACRLGEVALVPHSSPISQSGLLFYNTLFDENAASHIALGQAYAKGIRGGGGMSKDALAAHGANRSLIHIDWMIGSGETDVDGVSCRRPRASPSCAAASGWARPRAGERYAAIEQKGARSGAFLVVQMRLIRRRFGARSSRKFATGSSRSRRSCSLAEAARGAFGRTTRTCPIERPPSIRIAGRAGCSARASRRERCRRCPRPAASASRLSTVPVSVTSAPGDLHLDVRGIDPPVIGQAVGNVFPNAVVGAGVALRPAPAELVLAAPALGFVIAEPGRHLVGCAVPESALRSAATVFAAPAGPIPIVVAPAIAGIAGTETAASPHPLVRAAAPAIAARPIPAAVVGRAAGAAPFLAMAAAGAGIAAAAIGAVPVAATAAIAASLPIATARRSVAASAALEFLRAYRRGRPLPVKSLP